MYYSKGKLAECGSKIRKGWIAPATATAVERLEAAGSFRLGALNMVEFAYGPTGHNVHTGNVRNPWDHVAHHRRLVVRLGLGGRARGWFRRRSAPTPAARSACRRISAASPASSRPTAASAAPTAMPLSFTLDTVGPLAQTAEDCALVLSIIAGPDPLDPTTARRAEVGRQGDEARRRRA